jgi:hypothetical protein
MKKRRTAIVSMAAALSLSAAGYAAVDGHVPWRGQPSTTPPPCVHGKHNGHGYGHGGFDCGDGHGDEGNGGGHGNGHDR